MLNRETFVDVELRRLLERIELNRERQDRLRRLLAGGSNRRFGGSPHFAEGLKKTLLAALSVSKMRHFRTTRTDSSIGRL